MGSLSEEVGSADNNYPNAFHPSGIAEGYSGGYNNNMLPYLHYLTIPVGPINLQVWGIFFALSVIIASAYLVIEGKKIKLEPELIYDIIFWTLLGIVIGGRIGFVIAHLSRFDSLISYLSVWDGGLAYYGGFFGGLIFGSICIVKRNVNYLQFADLAAPAIALGLAVGRIGCYITGEHLGRPTNFFLGVSNNGTVIHQTSIYLIISNLIIFLILTNFKKKKAFDGQIALLFLLLYTLFRFIIDGFRADEPDWVGLTPSQLISIPIFILSVLGYLKMKKFKISKF